MPVRLVIQLSLISKIITLNYNSNSKYVFEFEPETGIWNGEDGNSWFCKWFYLVEKKICWKYFIY